MLLVLVLLAPLLLAAQPDPYKLPFADYSKNHLYYGKDSSLMMEFFKKVDELRSGKRSKVSIVHYGGSHIQAGFWSDTYMTSFQQLGNFEGGGIFAFPFKVAKTNSPNYYKSFSTGNWKRCRCVTKELCANLGMAGIAAKTKDSLVTFGVKLLENKHHKKFNAVRVYHNFDAGYELNICEGFPKHERKEEKEKGYTSFVFDAYIDSVNFTATRLDTVRREFMLEGFSLDNSNPGFYFAPFGVNGAASNSYLRCNMFGAQLESIKPDLVILSLGVNDTQGSEFTKERYMHNYDSLIHIIRKASPDCAILFTTTTDNYIRRKTPNKRPAKAQEAMFEMMDSHKAAVWDLYSLMGGYKSIYKWYKAGLAAKDRVHFNGKGYFIVGQLMFDAINKSYKNNSKIK